MTGLRSQPPSNPRPLQRLSRRVPRLAAAVTVAATIGVLAPGAAAAVTCGPVEGFSRIGQDSAGTPPLERGALYRLNDPGLLNTPSTFRQAGAIGSGWAKFAWTGAGGDGVLYALTSEGALLWYRYNGATWMAGSGKTVGRGFTPGSKVVNIAIGANGWLYLVQPDGKLRVYQHTGRLTGAASWANGGGKVIGSGWTGHEILAPQGDGTLYRQYQGKLYWFRHSDPSQGVVTWANAGRQTEIGSSGWNFYDLLAVGGGVLLATSAPSGQVSLYQHADPVGGTASWTGTATGVAKYLARSDSFGITVAPDTCS